MSPHPPAARPPRAPAFAARRVGGLLGGLLLLDVLVNLPSFAPAAPLRSLLAPSIDALVLVAACMGIAQAREPARRPLRIGLAAVALALIAAAAGLRFGWASGGQLFGSQPGQAMTAAAGWAVTALLAAAAAVAVFAISGLVVRGVEQQVVRSALLLVIALAAVLQVVSGRRLFTPSVIPRLIGLIG